MTTILKSVIIHCLFTTISIHHHLLRCSASTLNSTRNKEVSVHSPLDSTDYHSLLPAHQQPQNGSTARFLLRVCAVNAISTSRIAVLSHHRRPSSFRLVSTIPFLHRPQNLRRYLWAAPRNQRDVLPFQSAEARQTRSGRSIHAEEQGHRMDGCFKCGWIGVGGVGDIEGLSPFDGFVSRDGSFGLLEIMAGMFRWLSSISSSFDS